jgi:hypothetical protein
MEPWWVDASADGFFADSERLLVQPRVSNLADFEIEPREPIPKLMRLLSQKSNAPAMVSFGFTPFISYLLQFYKFIDFC